MEPVKGGNLVNLPEEAARVLEGLQGGSAASYALRFAAGFPGMMMVLSGMSTMEQMEDNISFMKDFKPLDDKEMVAVRLSSYSYFTDYRPLPVLEFGCHIFQELPDGKMLRADLLALAAL